MSRLGVVLVAVATATACNGVFRFDEDTPLPSDGGTDDTTDDDARAMTCKSDADCTLPGLRCESLSGYCVACLSDTDCATPLARCNLTAHVCVACLDTTDCGTHQRCDEATNTCLDTCFDEDDPCPTEGFVCDRHAKLCIECRESEHCIGNAHGAFCDPDIGRCVECLGHAQCPLERPRCDRRFGRCVACAVAADCAVGQACAPLTSTCAALP